MTRVLEGGELECFFFFQVQSREDKSRMENLTPRVGPFYPSRGGFRSLSISHSQQLDFESEKCTGDLGMERSAEDDSDDSHGVGHGDVGR